MMINGTVYNNNRYQEETALHACSERNCHQRTPNIIFSQHSMLCIIRPYRSFLVSNVDITTAIGSHKAPDPAPTRQWYNKNCDRRRSWNNERLQV